MQEEKIKIIALSSNELITFEYGEVEWKISPLPHGIKKELTTRSAEAVSDKNKVHDLIEIALDSIKYGLKGWEGLNYKNGEKAECKLTKCRKGFECLSNESLELIYRTSAFDNIAIYCLTPGNIPKYMLDAVNFNNDEKELTPEPIGKKKTY